MNNYSKWMGNFALEVSGIGMEPLETIKTGYEDLLDFKTKLLHVQ